MGLETATYPNNLNANWPLGTDPKAQGDDHLRLIKKVVKDVFPPGWDDASIHDLMKRFRSTVPPGFGATSGTAADLTTSMALLGATGNFVASSPNVFVDGWLNANKTAAANTVYIEARIFNVTTGVYWVTLAASHGVAAAAAAATSGYVPHCSRLMNGLNVGDTYKVEFWAAKQINEGPLAVTRWFVSGFCL